MVCLTLPHWSCSNCSVSILALCNGANTLWETPEGTDRTQVCYEWDESSCVNHTENLKHENWENPNPI